MKLGKDYVEARPVIRGILAFVIWMRRGSLADNPDQFFVVADTWLTAFEQRRS